MISDGDGPRLSLSGMAAQMVFADIRSGKIDFESVRALTRRGIGGFCLYGGSLFETFPLINALQKIAPIPLLMCADLENGAGQQILGATTFPPNMAVAATGDGGVEFARQKGLITAREAVAIGIHMILAPVVDVNRNRANPIINTRAFGDSPENVIRFARAFIDGCRRGRALTCLKHFPGHGGTSLDSHLELPEIADDASVVREIDLRPFMALLPDADSIMTAHVIVKALDDERPASLSQKITQALLRDEMGYNGVVFTDALIMQAITKTYGEAEAVLMAVEAGADVVLYPKNPGIAIDTIVKGVESGRIAAVRVAQSSERIMTLKRRTPLFDHAMVDPGGVERSVGTTAHRAAARKMTDAAVVTLRAPALPAAKDVLPLDIGGDHAHFWNGLAEAGIRINNASAETRVVAITCDPRAYHGKITLSPEEVRSIAAFAAAGTGTIVVIFGSPYIAEQVPANVPVICAWSPDESSQRAAADALAGRIEVSGALPISI